MALVLRYRVVPLALLVVAFTSGCSDTKFKTYRVDGRVVFEDQQPVKFGRIEFYQPERDVSAYASIREDGTFSMGTVKANDGAVEGPHQVMIMQMIMSARAGMPGVTEQPRAHGTHIARQFADFDSSGLTFVVEPHNKNFAEFVVSPD